MYGPVRLCDVRYYGVMCGIMTYGNARQDQVRNMKQDGICKQCGYLMFKSQDIQTKERLCMARRDYVMCGIMV